MIPRRLRWLCWWRGPCRVLGHLGVGEKEWCPRCGARIGSAWGDWTVP
jgi:hypothetical protein